MARKVRLNVPRLVKPTSRQISVTLRSVCTQQEHRALDAPALQVAVRRLAERGPEGADEVRLGDVGDAREGGDVERLRVAAVHRVAGAQQSAVGVFDGAAHRLVDRTQRPLRPRLMGMDPAVVDVAFEERYWYPHDGGVVWVSGYQLVDRESGRYLARDAPEVVEAGLIVASVAGAARHHAQALADEHAVAPGRPLTLRRDPDNEHDPNAIAVHRRGRRGAAGLGAARGRGRPGARRSTPAGRGPPSPCASGAPRRAIRAPG